MARRWPAWLLGPGVIPPRLSTQQNSLNNSVLGASPTLSNSCPAETSKINRLIAPIQDQFGDCPAAAWRMHQAMPGKTRHEIKIVELSGPRSDDRCGVELVLVIETRHRSLFFGALELRKASGQRRPDNLLEIVVVDVEVVPSRFVEVWYAAGVPFSLRAKRQPMHILDVGQRFDRFRCFEVMLVASHRLDRNRPSRHDADFFRPGAGSVDDRLGL